MRTDLLARAFATDRRTCAWILNSPRQWSAVAARSAHLSDEDLRPSFNRSPLRSHRPRVLTRSWDDRQLPAGRQFPKSSDDRRRSAVGQGAAVPRHCCGGPKRSPRGSMGRERGTISEIPDNSSRPVLHRAGAAQVAHDGGSPTANVPRPKGGALRFSLRLESSCRHDRHIEK